MNQFPDYIQNQPLFLASALLKYFHFPFSHQLLFQMALFLLLNFVLASYFGAIFS